MIKEAEQLHIFGYPEGCPACDALKDLLVDQGVSFTFHHLQRDCPTRTALRDTYGFQTVPQAFLPDGSHVGDYNEIRNALHAL